MARKKVSCWCSIRRVKSGPDRGSVGDMVCSTSKRTVRDIARKEVKRGRDKHLTKPKVTRAARSNCG